MFKEALGGKLFLCFTEEYRTKSVNIFFSILQYALFILELAVAEKDKVVPVVGEDKEKSALPLSNNLITISKLLVCACLKFQKRHQYDLLKPEKITFWIGCSSGKPASQKR